MNTDIIWFIEHTSRELDVACVVSYLVKKKYRKIIKILPYQQYDLSGITPKLVMLPYCYSINDRVLQHYLRLWPRAVYMNLAWEQIFYKANLEYKSPRDVFAKKLILHHCWSRDRAKFIRQKGVPREHIFINGHPTYKLYSLPYRKVYLNRFELAQQFNIDPKKKWIFFPENYSWFFYSDYNLEEIIKNGQNRKVAYLMRSYCRKAFKEVMGWLESALDKYGDRLIIILRPRPAFSLSYFKKVLNKLNPNLERKLEIIKDYSVREWILASDIVVSSFSTSLIESGLAGKPCFMLEPIKIPDILHASWYDLVSKVKTQADFFEICNKSYDKSNNSRLKNWAVSNFFVRKDPIMGLVNFIGEFDKAKYWRESEIKISGLMLLKSNIMNRLGNLKKIILREADYYSLENENKFMEETNRRINAYKEIL